ncbi:MAG TPA: hypothetical protein VFS43_47715 [Polyangiaceae bacterium]|nr:hypothetical protein [Polyangiaceae bacterium]
MSTYRITDRPPHCSACGSSALTPPTKFDASEGPPAVCFQAKKAERSLFGGPTMHAFVVDRARVCLDCGHVMLSFGRERLDEMRGMMASLKPIA